MDETIIVAFMGFMLVLALIGIASMWVLFRKAGKPGWAAIVPIYNLLVLLEIVGRPWWWIFLFLLCFIPIVGILVSVVLAVIIYGDLARSFGKGWGYAIGLLFLGIVFLPMLAFGDATYQGPAAKKA
jgi:hypothetical protein